MTGDMFQKLRLLTALAILAPATAQAQYIGGNAPPAPVAPRPGMAESPSAALARNVRILAASPRSYEALVGAGRAALSLGDAEAAVGFFGRAEEVNPRSWVPKVGQGAALTQLMDPQGALRAFAEAQQLGASQASVALDRGLAFDLSGDQARAQSDYRVALNGPDPSEARRRLALSQAISGRRAEALATLDPLLARRDPGSIRCRAFVLALTGDPAGARSAVNAALPGMASTMEPFLRKLANLRPDEKAAAVHFGVMPGSGAPSYAAATPQADRLADIEDMLRPAPPAPAPAARPAARPATPPPASASASASLKFALRPQTTAISATRRTWLQLASGRDANAFVEQFKRLKSRNRDLLGGISGYVAEEPNKARLVIGPFRNEEDARIFAEDLESVSVNAFPWTNAPGQPIRKIAVQ